MAINKVIFGGNTLIDLTGDTITAADLLKNKTAHDRSGAIITGTCEYDADTSDASAAQSDILYGETAYVAGAKLTGTMTNNGSVNGTILAVAGQFSIPQGYHDGGGKVGIAETEQAKIIAENIRKDITILGVTGTMSGSEDVHAQAKTATPKTTQQVITPDGPDYNYLSQVTVAAIPYTEVDNPQGGKTVTIAGTT